MAILSDLIKWLSDPNMVKNLLQWAQIIAVKELVNLAYMVY